MTAKKQRVIILILGAIAALGPFSIDMYLPGFSAIAEDLNTDISSVSLTLTSYFIGISVGQLVYGPIVDRYGRKKPLLVGLVIYLLAALACAFSPSINWLIANRLLLALGGCVGMVASRAIVRDLFPVNEVARVFSSLLLVMGVAPIIAPTVGGYITSSFGWEYIFIILSVIAALLILTVYSFLEESKEKDATVSLKPAKVMRGYLDVLKNREFLLYGLAGSLTMAAMFTYITGSPFVIMELYGFSETVFGWIFGFNAFGFILGSQLNRFWLRKRDSHDISKITAFGFFATTVLLLIGAVSGFLTAPLLIALLFSSLFLMGFINPNTTALALEPFDKNAGIASALIGSFRMLSGALASGLISLFFNGTSYPLVFIMTSCALIVFALLRFVDIQNKKLKTA